MGGGVGGGGGVVGVLGPAESDPLWSGNNFGGAKFARGEFRHTSDFRAGPSDAGNFDTPNPRLLAAVHTELGTGTRTAENSATIPPPWRPPPRGRHKGQEVSHYAKKFRGGKIRHTSSVGAGLSNAGNFNTPNPRLLVDNQLCETVVGPNFEQHQLIGNKTKKEQGPGRLSTLKELWGICVAAHRTGPPSHGHGAPAIQSKKRE